MQLVYAAGGCRDRQPTTYLRTVGEYDPATGRGRDLVASDDRSPSSPAWSSGGRPRERHAGGSPPTVDRITTAPPAAPDVMPRERESVDSGTWRPGTPGHVMVSVPRPHVAEVERIYAVGRRVNLFPDGRADGWIRITELRRVAERGGAVRYLLAFATCYPPAPPN